MYNSNSRKNKRIFILFLITTTISFLNFSQLNWNYNNSSFNPNSPTEIELLNELKTSDYSSSFVSTGENMNITLHQSYLNSSFDTIVNTSIVNGNNFTLPSPKDIMFNSTYTNMTVKDIIAPNKTLIIEDDYSGGVPLFQINNHYLSFNVSSAGFIVNISLRVYLVDTGDPVI